MKQKKTLTQIKPTLVKTGNLSYKEIIQIVKKIQKKLATLDLPPSVNSKHASTL